MSLNDLLWFWLPFLAVVTVSADKRSRPLAES